jgi:hypothetical protein
VLGSQLIFAFASQAVLTSDSSSFDGGPLPTFPSGYPVTDTEGFKLYATDGTDTFVVSLGTGGSTVANGHSFEPSLTYPYFAYTSTATNLDASDTNGFADVYVYNHQTQVYYLVSAAPDGSAGDGASGNAHVSVAADNTPWVTFTSAASNLVIGDTNGQTDLFLRNLSTGQTTLLSQPGNGLEADGASYGFAPGGSNFSFSNADHTYAFTSEATNMVEGDSNGFADIFLLDTGRGGTDVTPSNGTTAAFEQVAQVLDATLTVVADSARLTKATVQITGNYARGQDLLRFATVGTIKGTFDAALGTLTLSGWGTVAEYQVALRTVTYLNSSDAPNTGDRTLTFVTYDSHSSSAETQKTLSITAVNDAPILVNAIADQVLKTGSAFAFQIPAGTFVDPDGGALTYSVAGLPSCLTFDAQTRTFTGTPAAAGALVISFTVSDGSFSVSDSFSLVVNDPARLSNNTVAENSATGTVIGQFSGRDSHNAAYTYALTGDDPDNTAFRIVDGELVMASGAKLDFETKPSYGITVRVTDSTGDKHDETFTITLSDVAETPKGDAGKDNLEGDALDNILNGKGGNDRLTGGGGADTFVFGKGYGRDVIIDSDPSEGDIIELSGAVGIKNFRDLIKHHVEDIGNNLAITTGDGSVLVLKGVDLEDLSWDAFEF